MKIFLKALLFMCLVVSTPLVNFAQLETLKQLFKDECALNFSLPTTNRGNYYYYDYINDFRNGVDSFNSIYQYENDAQGQPIGRPLARSYENIKISGLDSIVSYVSTLKFEDNKTYPISKSYYYGINIHYGMEKDTMLMIFEPVILIPIRQPCSPDTQTCQVNSSKKYFKFDHNGDIAMIPYEKFDEYTNNYTSPKSQIFINHDPGGSNSMYHKYRCPNDMRYITDNDIVSTIIPIQQILLVYKGNGGEYSSNDTLNFFYVADPFRNYDRHHRKVLQPHVSISYNHLIISDKSKNSIPSPALADSSKKFLVKTINSFTNLGADYTEHCPNNCSHILINAFAKFDESAESDEF